MPPLHSSRDLFYAVVGLRALDARERAPRRFGPDAEARWATFKHADGLPPSINGRLPVPAPLLSQRLVMPDVWLSFGARGAKG